jgi:iron(III) transport system ATP-binding protein
MSAADGHLVLAGLVKRFRGAERPALDGLDLDVQAGTILVLLGTSGAGKTTLLRIVAGLEAADAGRVQVGERTLSDPRILVAPESRGVGLVFQHLELWPHMTVAENIAFGLAGRPRGRAAREHATVRELARDVGVEALLARRPGTLSGGERQRVAIARTLAPAPTVILYDEPLANLDPDRRTHLRSLIRRLCRERSTTLVYVTHDADEAMELGDEVAVLHRGRIVDRGPPAALYRAPQSLAGARALGTLTVLPGTVSGGVVQTPLGRLEVSGAAPDGAGRVLLRPEALEVAGTGDAVVLEARPRAGGWRFTARLDEHVLEGRSATELTPGQRVGLHAHGPVSVIALVEETS